MPTVDERVDRLESLLGQFIVNTDMALRRLEAQMESFRREAEEDRRALHERMEVSQKSINEEFKKVNRMWSDLAKKMGTLVEDLVAPALKPVLKKYFNCDVIMDGQRIYKRLNGKNYEVDSLAVCEGRVFMMEVRSTPWTQDVREIAEKSKKFFEFFPEYKGKELVIIIGGITFPQEVIKYATRRRIYVLGWRQWKYMDILNFDDIKKK